MPENEEGSEKEEMVTAYATAKMQLLEYITTKKRRRQKETIRLFNISMQLDKQTTEIKRISSVLQHIQKYVKRLGIQQLQLIKQLQLQ